MRLYLILLMGAVLAACGDPIKDNIDDLIAGGAGAEKAKMRLALAKKSAIAPLIAAFEESDHASRARLDMVEALKRLYLREPDERILKALIAGLGDKDPAVRRKIAWACGDLRQRETIAPLLDQLERDDDDDVRLEILVDLEIMSMRGAGGNFFDTEVTTEDMEEEERQHFTRILTQMAQRDLADSLRLKTLEWLEIIAEEKTIEAHSLMLQAQLDKAEQLLLKARELVPDSKNVNQKLGRFYYDNDQEEKGLELLTEFGMVMRVPRLAAAPAIDGELDDPAWSEVRPVTEFFQCVFAMRAYRIQGESEAYVGWRDDTVYIGVKGYEATTENLAAAATQRDQNTWLDDCVEIFFDVNHDYTTFHQVVVNSPGIIFDLYSDGSTRGGDVGWNGEYEVATKVEDNFWTVEIGVPASTLQKKKIQAGDTWGFNVARIRIANAAEYGQWVPTYGSSQRPERFGFLIFNE